MRYETLEQGFVTRRTAGTPTALAIGPRCAITRDGEVVCIAHLTAGLGQNDCKSLLCRSSDSGVTWREQGLLWPELQHSHSTTVSISRSAEGGLFCFGTHWVVDHAGETYWSRETQGLKQNELIWSCSQDDGFSWKSPDVIPMPIPGAAEAPGPMCIARDGKWHCCYSPFNTLDPAEIVDRSQVVLLTSADRGETWTHRSLFRFEDSRSSSAISWVIELADGRLLGTCWHVSNDPSTDYPNPYTLSRDGGVIWSPAQSTGILGQTPSLTALPDGRVLFAYNQRRHGEPGVWLAVAKPDERGFGIEHNELVWRAEKPTQSGSSGEYSLWEDFAFGEPSTTLLPDGTILLVLWCVQPSGQGIRYVRLKVIDSSKK